LGCKDLRFDGGESSRGALEIREKRAEIREQRSESREQRSEIRGNLEV
jgi:hypothetical protein